MLEILDLIITFDREILRVDYLCLNSGLVFIKGESGSGKTSLFKCIESRIRYKGLIKREGIINYYHESEIINDNCSLENVKKIDNNIDLNLYYELLLKLEMVDKELIKVKYLSKGEKQRAELIVTLSRRSDIYLLDEPCSSLNDKYRKIVYRWLDKYKNKKLILCNSHDSVIPTFKIEDGKLIGKCIKGKEIKKESKYRYKFNVLLMFKLMFSKIETTINILNVSFSSMVFYFSFNIDKIVDSKINIDEYSYLLEDIFIKFEYLFVNIRLIGLIVFISSLGVYILSNINEVIVNKNKIDNIMYRFSNVKSHFIIRYILEIIVIIILSVVLILIANAFM